MMIFMLFLFSALTLLVGVGGQKHLEYKKCYTIPNINFWDPWPHLR